MAYKDGVAQTTLHETLRRCLHFDFLRDSILIKLKKYQH